MAENYEKITLQNGLRVILEQDDSLRSASICLFIGAGSRNENIREAGTAHFLEHILFRGTGSRSSEQIARQIDRMGGTVNAATSRDYIALEAKVLYTHALEALELVCDMITDPLADQSAVEAERGVILEEIAMCEDNADEVIWDTFYSEVWKDTTLGRRTLGTRNAVSSMTAERVRSFMKRRFIPQRMIVSVVGRFPRGEVLELIGRTLGSMERGRAYRSKPVSYTPSVKCVEWRLEHTHLLLGFPAYCFGDSRQTAQRFVESMCGEGYSTRLYRRLRDELGIVYDVSCSGSAYEHEGVLAIEFSCTPDNEDNALREALRIVKELGSDGIDREEFELARERLLVQAALSGENPAGRAFDYVSDELWLNRIDTTDTYLERIRNVTLEQVNQAARELLDMSALSIIAVGETREEEYYRALAQSMR